MTLTIESYDQHSQLFTLRIPNREVELGFYRLLLAARKTTVASNAK
ncbi:MAG: hypothetical protein K2N48_09060 [Muribaculaceae bacterium]|nr:hypothetical protein [Muribaculaceae bacterium]